MNLEQYSSVKIDNTFKYKTSKVRFLKKVHKWLKVVLIALPIFFKSKHFTNHLGLKRRDK